MKVAYLLSHGFAARMVLHSELIRELRDASIDTLLVGPDSARRSLEAFADGTSVQVATAPFPKSKLRAALGEARRYLREPIRDNAALWSRHLYYVNGQAGAYAKLLAQGNYLAHRLLFNCRWAHRAFDGLDRARHRSKPLRQVLSKTRPDLVVATYPVSSFEVAALLEAKSMGIPTVGHLLSWDNITCKGRFTAVPDSFISWGPVMTEELQTHYGVAPSDIHECGVPHFDAHRNLVNTDCLRQVLKSLQLEPEAPYLFFGMSAPIFAPREIDVVEWLAGQIRSDAFGPRMQLIVRPHPQNVTGYLADASWLPRLKALAGPRVGINLPRLTERGLDWDMEQDDLTILVNLLAGSSICLNSGSTLSIDALMHDKPVLVTLFDADQQLPWWQSARRIAEFPHYRTLLQTGGVAPVFSFDQLRQQIEQSIASPGEGIAMRKKAIQRECGAVDGQASRRVARALRVIHARASNRVNAQ